MTFDQQLEHCLLNRRCVNPPIGCGQTIDFLGVLPSEFEAWLKTGICPGCQRKQNPNYVPITPIEVGK